LTIADENQQASLKDPLEVISRAITKSKAKKIKEVFKWLIQDI
jgi:hypothetical protein